MIGSNKSRDGHEQERRRCIVFHVNTVNPSLTVNGDQHKLAYCIVENSTTIIVIGLDCSNVY